MPWQYLPPKLEQMHQLFHFKVEICQISVKPPDMLFEYREKLKHSNV